MKVFLKKIHSETIQYELERNKHLVDRLLSDITYQSADNLVSATLHTFKHKKQKK